MTIHQAKRLPDMPAELTAFEGRHLSGALKLSQEMGWPYRLADWEIALELGQGLVLERAGAVIGTALWWTYGSEFATIGMILVTGAEQGRGHGARLFNGLLAATQGRNLLLNSTDEGLALYARAGFRACAKVLQFQGILSGDVALPGMSQDIRGATAADLAAIRQIDARASGMPRDAMLAALARMGRVMVMAQADQIAGYAIARDFGRGQVVGPVVAQSPEQARQLVLAQLHGLRGCFVRIDVYAEDGLGPWLEGLGLACVGHATAMFKGQMPRPDNPDRVFALANQSFG